MVRYKAHRIIWKMIYGENPKFIDHIDGNPENNKLHNLRSVTKQTNAKNQRLRSTNTSGVNGVSWKEGKNIWRVRVRERDTHIHLGHFANFEDAVACRQAYDDANGYHPNHGKARA